jgi:hypothetical protein
MIRKIKNSDFCLIQPPNAKKRLFRAENALTDFPNTKKFRPAAGFPNTKTGRKPQSEEEPLESFVAVG